MIPTSIFGQYLSSTRSLARASSLVFTDDVNSVDWNPAGLMHIAEWEIAATSFYAFHGSPSGPTFHSIGIGRQVADNQVIVFRVSPGLGSEFIVPASLALSDSSVHLTTTFEKKINYDEPLAFGYAVRFSRGWSTGLSLHYYNESLTETHYSIDSASSIHTSLVDYGRKTTTLDGGFIFAPESGWRFSATLKNFIHLRLKSDFPVEDEPYSLSTEAVLHGGIGYTGFRGVRLGFEVDSKLRALLGGEFRISSFLRGQTGFIVHGAYPFSLEAVTLGMGATFAGLQFDAAYLGFLQQQNRQGSADIGSFEQLGVGNIEYNAYTSDRISITGTAYFRSATSVVARIEYVDLTNDIYPVLRTTYAIQPVGKARVRNTSSSPVTVTASLHVPRFMDEATDSPEETIEPGMTAEIPLYAVFSEALTASTSLVVQEAEVRVRTFQQNRDDDHYQVRMLVHAKNDWNGEVALLPKFVTPDDGSVIRFTRSTLAGHKEELDSVPAGHLHFQQARLLFDAFTRSAVYVSDPQKSEDVVQYASETLASNSGDCDDLSVCFASLLASIGIRTAFVEVKPPETPGEGHVYVLFDTGISPREAGSLSGNPKRYVIRKTDPYHESLWIPVETTSMKQGFEEAWSMGAKEYYEEVEVQLGMIKGWVHLYDVLPNN
jgi:hypothetical protein